MSARLKQKRKQVCGMKCASMFQLPLRHGADGFAEGVVLLSAGENASEALGLLLFFSNQSVSWMSANDEPHHVLYLENF